MSLLFPTLNEICENNRKMLDIFRDTQGARETLIANWHLGLTSFGGPPVHFKIFHTKFVKKLEWIDEQLYNELFSVSQALPGPASTKMLYCINMLRNGLLAAISTFLLWSLPGALGMYGLSIGISSIQGTLPRVVYAFLSGLNAATVGVIALAAVELSAKAITDDFFRIVLFLSACAALMYSAPWYLPVLIVSGGCTTIVYDYRWLHGPIKAAIHLITRGQSRIRNRISTVETSESNNRSIELTGGFRTPIQQAVAIPAESIERTLGYTSRSLSYENIRRDSPLRGQREEETGAEREPRVLPSDYPLKLHWKSGTAIIAFFIVLFGVIITLKAVLPNHSVLYSLFANLYLAGTIIVGGGPVVIPLLREYIVAEGWVSPRDFLIGLAIAQSFPGPNFNFAVFLGSLTAVNNGYPSALGAMVAFLGIFLPGMVLVQGTMGIWAALRGRRWVKSMVRGVSAGATGFIYTAVYRIWQVGYIDEGFQAGKSLGDDPWWVVVTATAFVGCRYFRLPPPVVIGIGAIMGMIRFGVSTMN
ncbi:chromate transporter-domain-containing protein [Hypoxylon sp. NC0597]|nr:chromate transporter-domain-containing protein [Hypoxylon sp. NC0597]